MMAVAAVVVHAAAPNDDAVDNEDDEEADASDFLTNLDKNMMDDG